MNVAAIATHGAVSFGGRGVTTPASETSNVADTLSTHDSKVCADLHQRAGARLHRGRQRRQDFVQPMLALNVAVRPRPRGVRRVALPVALQFAQRAHLVAD